jgi:hypothetical protein
MKIILSRKGFDSSYGGFPSPILPDGRLFSIPIPLKNQISYAEIKFDDKMTLLDLMTELYPCIYIRGKKYELTNKIKCHLDPDLNYDSLKRTEQWKPLFGQNEAAQSHLDKHKISVGDLFLFFGLFRETEFIKGKFSFKPYSKQIHCIYGYLQIGKVHNVTLNQNNNVIAEYHPHFEEMNRRIKNNTIYESAKILSFKNDIPGAGIFNFSKKFVLTKNGYCTSQWDLPDSFRNINISYHTNSKRYGWKGDYFQSAYRGQEFVIEENEQIENWANELISEAVTGKVRVM